MRKFLCGLGACVCLAAWMASSGCGPKGDISIGAVGDLRLTGKLGEGGFRNGVAMGEEAVNEAGGVKGALLRVTYFDDQGDPAVVPKVAEKLISSGVTAIVGHNTSSTTAAALPIVNRNKVLLFGPEATSSEFSGKDDYFIRNEVAEKSMAEALADYAVQSLKLRSVGAVLDEKNRPFTRPFFDAFRKKMEALGGEAELLYPYFSLDVTEAARQTDAYLKRGGRSVLLITNAADTRLLGQAVRRVRNDLPLLGTTWAVPPTGAEQLGPLPDDLVFPCTFDPDSKAPAYLKFKQRYEKHYGIQVDYHAVHAYEAMQILARAMAKAGTDSTKIRKAVTSIGAFEGLQGPIRIDPFGDCQRQIWMLKEVAGALRRVGGKH